MQSHPTGHSTSHAKKKSILKSEGKSSEPTSSGFTQIISLPAEEAPSTPNQLTDESKNQHVFTSEGPLTRPEEKAKDFSPGAPQGPLIRNAPKIPDDGGRCVQIQSENENQATKNSENNGIRVLSHDEFIGDVHLDEKNRDQCATMENKLRNKKG